MLREIYMTTLRTMEAATARLIDFEALGQLNVLCRALLVAGASTFIAHLCWVMGRCRHGVRPEQAKNP